MLVAEERRDQVVQHFKYNHMVFFRHVHEVVVRIIIFNLLEKKVVKNMFFNVMTPCLLISDNSVN